MKELKGDMLIEDMNLKAGEIFLIKGVVWKYDGMVRQGAFNSGTQYVEKNGKTYDRIVPVK